MRYDGKFPNFYWHPAGGGINHPRNYVVMHASLNRSFGERLPDYKFAYIETHCPMALRQVQQFVTAVRRSPLSIAAERHYMQKLLQPWRALYD